MASDALLDLFVENAAPLLVARVSQYELNESINDLLNSWPRELHELAADLQYKGMREAAAKAGIDFDHPALSPIRAQLRLRVEYDLAAMASLN